MSSIPPEEVEYQEARFHEDESRSLAAFFTVCLGVTFFCMVSRTTSRLLTSVGLRADDWTFLVGALIASGSFAVLMIYAFDAGLGRHWLSLSAEEVLLFPKLNYAYNILNVTCYPIIKISILLLYLRIFATGRFQKITWCCIAFVAMVGISNALVAIFACRPIRGFYDKSVKAFCIDSVSFYWANATLNVVTDAIVLLLPMPVIWRLQMPLRRKIGLSLLFILGGLTFVISILRIVYYLRVNIYDISYTFIGTAYSTPGEVTLAIFCSCAPTWRPLSRRLVEIARSHFSSIRSSRTYYDVEQKGSSDYDKPSRFNDSRSSRNDAGSNVELICVQSTPGGKAQGIYEAKQNGIPDTQADAYTLVSEQERYRDRGGTDRLPINGIQVKHEVKIEETSNRT